MSNDLRRMVGEIRQALDAYPREQLQEILAYVFKEYVVEGAATPTGAMAMLEARTELEGLSFAELITWLQLHLDVPELALFDVQNGRVSVRVGARVVELTAAAPQPSAVSPPPSAQPVPTPAVVPPPTQSAPPPTQSAPPPTQSAPPPATAQPAPKPEEKKEEPEAASSRFSWLEVD